MLSASAYSFRQKARLAISLSWIAGFTNVVTFLVCTEVVSHVTGNATHFSRTVVEWFMGSRDAGRQVVYFGILMFCFVAGAFSSALMTEGARRRGWQSKYILPLAVEATLLSVMSLLIVTHKHVAQTNTVLFIGIVAAGATAMGLQNATITKISGAVVRTTHLTGVFTDIGIESVQMLFWTWDKLRTWRWNRLGRTLRVSQRHPSARRILLLASIVGSFCFGAVLATYLYHEIFEVAMGFPIVFLFWIIFIDYTKPIADVREIDLLADKELKILGIVETLLPRDMGIFRMSHHRGEKMHRAPDFQAWVDRLPERWTVTVLALSPWTQFDADSVQDLRMAALRLKNQGRTLVISGVNPKQYKLFSVHGLLDMVSPENICPDIEFAIARGIELSSNR